MYWSLPTYLAFEMVRRQDAGEETELSHGKVQLQDNTMPRTNLTRGARISRLPENIGRQPPDEDMN